MGRYLTDENAHKVCKLLEDGYSNKEIAKKFNVTCSIVNTIRHGKTYKEISRYYDIKPLENEREYRLSEETVHRVCKLLQEGYGPLEVSKMTDISRRSVYNIRTGHSYSNIASQYNVNGMLYSRKLKVETVKNICKLLEEGYSNKEIFDKLHVKTDVISSIRRGLSHRDISKNYNINSMLNDRLDEQIVHKICKLLEEGYRNSEIGDRYNIDECIISDIRNGESYSEISKKYDIERRYRQGKINEKNMHIICAMKESGLSIKDISKELNIGTTAIYRALKIPKFEHIRREYNI